jgi:hypothetical protein
MILYDETPCHPSSPTKLHGVTDQKTATQTSNLISVSVLKKRSPLKAVDEIGGIILKGILNK